MRLYLVRPLSCRFLLLSLVLLAQASSGHNKASAQVLLSDGLTLVQEGPVVAAGDPVPNNLASGATAFSHSDLGPQLGIDFHVAANLNDGKYGNNFSWIGGDPQTNPLGDLFIAGIDLGPATNVSSIAFGRDSSGAFTDRNLGTYTLQFTTAAEPTNPLSSWTDIGTLEYVGSAGQGTHFRDPWLRHGYNFDAVMATGIRLVVPASGLSGGTGIDEIELYGDPLPVGPVLPAPPTIVLAPETGFQLSWDGNDGDFFDPTAPPGGARVPNNDALASRGATPFSSSDLGPELGIDFHVASNINDGFYGNANSWIGGDPVANPGPAFVGVAFGAEIDVTSVAWSRDNGNGEVDDSAPGTDCCGGQLDDRTLGTYTLQYTLVADPSAATQATGDATTGWQTVGSVEYINNLDLALGGGFTSFLRHEFEVATADGSPVRATGLRLLVPATGVSGGTAIDEFEVNTVPEPGTLLLASSVVVCGLLRRRR